MILLMLKRMQNFSSKHGHFLTQPEKVTHPSGRAYGLVYDDAGSLREVVTPRGSAYTLQLSTSLGFYRLRLALPIDSIALQVCCLEYYTHSQ